MGQNALKVKDATILFAADDIHKRKSLREIISELSKMEATPTIEVAIYYLQELEHILNIAKTITLSQKVSRIPRFKDGTKVKYIKQKATTYQQFYVGKIGRVLDSSYHKGEYFHDVEFEDGQMMLIIGRFLEPIND